jgi:hypothetical protein
LPTIGDGDRAIRVEPSVESVVGWMPGHGAVVGVASCHDSARATHTAHLAQCGHWIVYMLKHLMSMDDVECAVAESNVVHIANTEFDVGDAGRRIARRLVDDHFGAIDSDHTAGFDTAGEVHRECAGATSDIEKGGAAGKASGEVAG